MHSSLAVKERPTTVTILVDRELRTLLEDTTRANERSLGAEVRHLLRRHLERADTEREAHERGGERLFTRDPRPDPLFFPFPPDSGHLTVTDPDLAR